MTNVQIRDVPEDVLENLKKAAADQGRSLQGYLLDLLSAEAGVQVNRTVFAEAAADPDGYRGAAGDAAELIRQAREERAAALAEGG